MDLTQREQHFEFGENWARFSDLVDEPRIEAAIANVRALVGDLKGKSFLDIGCGSGLFSLAALRLGADRVMAVDLDENSVATTRKLLGREGGSWRAEPYSVFDLPEEKLGTFDVVYSWGVLHHTGDMWRAIKRASEMVAPGGTFAFALYERTPLCGAWTIEKRLYRKLPSVLQSVARSAYMGAYSLGLIAQGRNPFRVIRDQRPRGMNMSHDVHDWMGGYPYESTGLAEVDEYLGRLGFERRVHKPVAPHLGGLFGSGCSEYVYERV